MMNNLVPTKIFKGENILVKNKEELIIGNKAFIVTGKSSGEKSGALKDVTDILDEKNISYLIYNKITNNPTLEETYEGGKIAREFSADFIIGIGGGSPLDAAKAIATFSKNDIEPYDIFNGEFKNKPLPMVAIPTTAGTGSETTQYSILTLHKEKTKRSFAHKDVFYKKAFIDGRYMKDLPLYIKRNTYVDSLCHLIEGYTNKKANDLTDPYAIEGLKLFSEYKENYLNGNFSIEDCTNLLYGASIGGAVIAHTGTTIIHSMGYPLTYYKDIPHGRANGILLIEYLRRTNEVLEEKVNNILANLDFKNIDEFESYLNQIIELKEEISLDEIYEWTKTTIQSKNVLVCPFLVDYDKEIEIYEKSVLKR